MARNLSKQLQNGLILWLDGNGKDLSGNGNNATLNNSPTKTRVLQNDGLGFNGSNTSAITSNNVINLASDYTISCWVKLNVVNTNSNGIIATRDYGNNITYAYYNLIIHRQDQGNIVLQGQSGASQQFTEFTGTNSIGIWYNIVATCESNIVKTWVNGRYTGNSMTFTPGDNVGSNPRNIVVGCFQSEDLTISNFGNNTVINPMAWNRALSSKEIEMLYISTFIK